MAHYAGRHIHTDGSYSILIDPSAPKHARGQVHLDSGEVLEWSSPAGRDVWIAVGHHRQGLIREPGFPDATFRLPSPNIQ